MTGIKTHNVHDEVEIRMGSEGLASIAPRTVIDVFKSTVEKYGDKDAMKYEENAEWISITYSEYFAKCKQFAKSLLFLECKPFQATNIIGFNSKEWLIANFGSILAGGIAAGIYTTNNPESCKYVSEHSEAIVVVCDGLDQLKKFTDISKKLKHLKALVVYNVETVPEDLTFAVPVYTFSDFLTLGKDIADDVLNARMEAQKPGNCCTLIYTSGTTGNPKAVMISHDNVTWTARNVLETVNGITPADRIVSYLPLSHIAAQMVDMHGPLLGGACVYFAKPDALKGSLGGTLKAAKPTIFFGVPRVWEKIAEKMRAAGKLVTGLKKKLVTWCKEKGMEKSQLAQFGQSGGAPCGYGFAEKLVLSKIKDTLGLSECRLACTGAAPITHEILEYFASVDIPIYELFGQSECTGPQTLNVPESWKLTTTGRAIQGTEMKVLEGTQELVYRGRNIMMGYMKNKKATDDTIDAEGWLHSGDCAKIDEDGFMSITGRIKELIITAGGENIPPVLIEDKIKEHAKALSNVMVIGDKRKFLSALFCLRVKMDEDGNPTNQLDAQALDVAKEIGSKATTVAEAQMDEAFKTYLDKCVAAANKEAISRAQNVQKWKLLENDFSVPGGELTPTLKLKRRIVSDKYSDVIEGMYA